MTLLYLVLAIVFEVGWATGMKVIATGSGSGRAPAMVFTGVSYVLALVFLTLATKKLDVGVAYALWAGSGAAVIAVIGVLYFREPLTALKAGSLALIILGVVGLQLSGGGR